MPGQVGVDPSIVAVEQLQQAAVLAHQSGEKLSRLSHHGFPQSRRELGELLRIRSGYRAQCSNTEPLTHKLFG